MARYVQKRHGSLDILVDVVTNLTLPGASLGTQATQATTAITELLASSIRELDSLWMSEALSTYGFQDAALAVQDLHPSMVKRLLGVLALPDASPGACVAAASGLLAVIKVRH